MHNFEKKNTRKVCHATSSAMDEFWRSTRSSSALTRTSCLDVSPSWLVISRLLASAALSRLRRSSTSRSLSTNCQPPSHQWLTFPPRPLPLLPLQIFALVWPSIPEFLLAGLSLWKGTLQDCTTHTTTLQPLGWFCWSKVLLPACRCWWQLVHSE